MASSTSKASANTSSKVFDYQPKSRWCEDEESKVLQVELPDFKRDELKVQTDASGRLRVSGQRRIDSTKSSRFEESFPIPGSVEHSSIKAKFDSGTLHVIMPIKKTTPLMSGEDSPATGETQTESGDGKPGRGGRGLLGFCLGTRKRQIVSACVGVASLATVLGLYVAYRQGYPVGDWNRWKTDVGETFALEKFPLFPRF